LVSTGLKEKTRTMKKSVRILTILEIFGAAIILPNSCSKSSNSSSNNSDNQTNDNNAANTTAKAAAADYAYDDAFNIAVQTGNNEGLDNLMQGKGKVGSSTLGDNIAGAYYCAMVTVSGSTFPVTVTVDFGSGCKSADSISRSGSITYVFSGHLSVPGTTISASFNNYVVNGYELNGTYSITNSTTNISSPQLTTTLSNGNITFPSDTTYYLNRTKTVAVVSGSISDISSLVFNITGNFSFGSSFGDSLTATITSPLERKETCNWVDSGIVSFTYSKAGVSVSGTLDYGSGTCDNLAEIEIGSFTEEITIL
jgi:hypothetical protein